MPSTSLVVSFLSSTFLHPAPGGGLTHFAAVCIMPQRVALCICMDRRSILKAGSERRRERFFALTTGGNHEMDIRQHRPYTWKEILLGLTLKRKRGGVEVTAPAQNDHLSPFFLFQLQISTEKKIFVHAQHFDASPSAAGKSPTRCSESRFSQSGKLNTELASNEIWIPPDSPLPQGSNFDCNAESNCRQILSRRLGYPHAICHHSNHSKSDKYGIHSPSLPFRCLSTTSCLRFQLFHVSQYLHNLICQQYSCPMVPSKRLRRCQ